jgi:hypothetical protein
VSKTSKSQSAAPGHTPTVEAKANATQKTTLLSDAFDALKGRFDRAVARARKDRRFARGLVVGALLTIGFVGYGVAALATNHAPGMSEIAPLVKRVLAPRAESDLFPKPVYISLYDADDKEEIQRELVLQGSENFQGTYRNLKSGRTGKVVGFRRGETIQLAFAADPEKDGQPRMGLGSIKLTRVRFHEANLIVYVGHEEGCSCSGGKTTAIPAILTEMPQVEKWLKDTVFTKSPITIDFVGATHVAERRDKLMKSVTE